MRMSTTRTRIAVAVLVSMVGSPLVGPSASARTEEDCKRAQGNWLDVLNGTTTSGTITNAGLLNGWTETVYNPAVVFTLDPNVVSFVAETTITTNDGVLVTNNVYLYNFVTGLGTVLATVDPSAGSGRFDGASGVLYFNQTATIGVPPNQSYEYTIDGTVCLSKN